MEEFLKNLQLSNEAINLYINSLGQSPLTLKELNAIMGNLDRDSFIEIIDDLINMGLYVQIEPKKPEILKYFLAIPPIAPILSYYSNINQNIPNIANQVQELINNSLTQIIQSDENKVELNTFYRQFQEIKKDLDEVLLIQKIDIEDIIGEFDTILEMKSILSDTENIILSLNQKLKTITQTQLTGLIKVIMDIKTNLIELVKELGLKKNEVSVITVIEEVFQKKIQTSVDEFTNALTELIEVEFEKTTITIKKDLEPPIQQIINKSIQIRNEFKNLILNLLKNIQDKLNEIQVITENNIENLSNSIIDLKNVISENLTNIIQDTINQISALNQPIEQCMRGYIDFTNQTDKINIDNIWLINNENIIKDGISNLINNSKNLITIIVPKLENFINKDLFNNISKDIKIKIASSDPHTNSIVRGLKDINNLEFKQLKNDNLFALKGDNKYLIIAIHQKDSKDPLNNCIGIGTNYPPIINKLNSIIETTWSSAQGDRMPMGRTVGGPPSGMRHPVKATPLRSMQAPTTPAPKVMAPPQEMPTAPLRKASPPKLSKAPTTPAPSTQPESGGNVSKLINNAFNNLIQQLDNFTGIEFSKALQGVSDVILENKGYSVTLHSVGTWVNNYKNIPTPLITDDKKLILEAIEGWKQRFS